MKKIVYKEVDYFENQKSKYNNKLNMGNLTSKQNENFKGVFGKELELLNNICYSIINKDTNKFNKNEYNMFMNELNNNHLLILEKNLNKHLKVDLENIQCTKLQSKIIRSYSDNHSLKTLIKEFINIDVSKQFQSSDFGGELSTPQLKYCANDVIYLHKIHNELTKILIRAVSYTHLRAHET